MTGTDIITSAMRLIGMLPDGEPPTSAEMEDARLVLNDMIEGWNIDPTMIWAVPRSPFALIATTASYLLGAAQTFNLARPARIVRYGLVTNGVETPLLMMSDKQYAETASKAATALAPTSLYDDGGFPYRTLRPIPIPTVGGLILAVYYWQPISTFADVVTDQIYPPGYTKMMRYNLAVDLAQEYGSPVPAIVAAIAVSSKQAVQAMNAARGPIASENPVPATMAPSPAPTH